MIEKSILEGNLKMKVGFMGMWKPCKCQLFSNYIIVTQGINNPMQIKIEVSKNHDITLEEYNNKHIMHIRTSEQTHHFAFDSNMSMKLWYNTIKTLHMRQCKLSMDDFTIVCTLGRGYFGKVLLVEHNETHEVYAIKAIKKASLVNENKIHTIFVERNILMMSHHPFIVSMMFAFQNDKKFYLGLEYVPGGALFRFLQIGRVMKEPEVRFYVAETALALHYLHSIGILYRDLKLENVLLASDGHIKLTDFGLSKSLMDDGALRQTSTFCGTNEYLPPEMIKDQSYGFEIDWWTLGIYTYEFLFGETPFYHRNLKKMYRKIVTKEPKFPKKASPEAKAFIKKLLVKDPAKRAGFNEIKNDPFFAGINWVDVLHKKLDPPYIPKHVTGRRATNVGEKYKRDKSDSDAETVEDEFEGFSFAGEY